MVEVIKILYESPTFELEINGVKSTRKRQKRGSRQGCPLSPYLFVILTTTLFHDVHHRKEERNDKPNGVNFTEVLYADEAETPRKSKKYFTTLKTTQRSTD
eukprot:5841999-Karenia_brevis.AAC.1